MSKFFETWTALPSKKKQMVIYGSVFAVIIIVVFGSAKEPVEKKAVSQPNELSFIGTEVGEMDMEQLAGQNELLKNQVNSLQELALELKEGQDSLKRTIAANKELTETPQLLYDIERKYEGLSKQVSSLERDGLMVTTNNGYQDKQENDFIDSLIEDTPAKVEPKGDDLVDIEPIFIAPVKKKTRKVDTVIPDDPLAYVDAAYRNSSYQSSESTNMFVDDDDIEENPVATPNIEVVSSKQEYVEDAPKKKEKEYIGAILPAGSLISGVLISGFDAPTGKAAEKGALSTTMRVTGPAILPNGERVDLEGCFVTLDVKGEAATERAKLRSQRLTCMLEAGVVDTKIKGNVSGKDGSKGLRGKLINKQGKALLYSAISGTIGGFGKAFSGNGQNNIIASGNGYQLPELSEATTSGLGQGIGDSSDMLMEYYKEQLDLLYPVIEIKPMVFGSIHIIETVQLTLFKGKKAK